MKLTDISGGINEWFSGEGPLGDVVISSRVRLARNVAGYKFLAACSAGEKAEILKKLKDVVMGLDFQGDEIFYIGIDKAPILEKRFLVERHLISQHHAFGKGPRGAVIARREFFTAMINEEDHLRLQVLKSGCQLPACIEQIDRIDNAIEEKIEYAFSPQYGYLTACPTNLGTGARVSVMLHMPALKITGQIDKFLNAAKALGLAVRGLFGEGTDAAGDFYQLSNQVTLGVREKEIAERFEKTVIPEIVEFEHSARKRLLARETSVLDDKISRALALLKNAHLISSQEAMFLLSHIRLGLNMHEFQGATTPAIKQLCSLGHDGGSVSEHCRLSIATVNRLFLLTLPAHLQLNYGKELDSTHRDALRAQIIRAALKG